MQEKKKKKEKAGLLHEAFLELVENTSILIQMLFWNILEVHFALHHPLFFQLSKWVYEKGGLTDIIIVIEIFFEFKSLFCFL